MSSFSQNESQRSSQPQTNLMSKVGSALDKVETAIVEKVENFIQQEPDEVETVQHSDTDDRATQVQSKHMPHKQDKWAFR